MSFLGDIFGYDENGFDFMGVSQDSRQNCPMCGRAAILHSPKQEAICLQKIFGGYDDARRIESRQSPLNIAGNAKENGIHIDDAGGVGDERKG